MATLKKEHQDIVEKTDKDVEIIHSELVDHEKKLSSHEQALKRHDNQIADTYKEIEQTREEVNVIHNQQDGVATRVSHAEELVKQISYEHSKQMDNVDIKISSLVEAGKQLSEDVVTLRQVSSNEDQIIKEHVQILERDVDCVKSDVAKVIEEVEVLRDKGMYQQNHPIVKLFYYVGTGLSSGLGVSHFESDISYYNDKYHDGTRQWIFDEVSVWLQQPPSNKNQPSICLISGNPGMGKSVIAAKLSSSYKFSKQLAGCFFFQHHMGRRSNPKALVQSLCYQFLSTIDGYSALIEEFDPSVLNLFELFSYLIKEPLHRLPPDHEKIVIVIDALDECDFESRSDLLKLFVREFIKLPKWVYAILTSRPDQKILQSLKRIKHVIKVEPDDPRNIDDIRHFLHDFLTGKMPPSELGPGIDLLVKKSEGMFLYFHYAIDTLEDKDTISLQDLETLLPDGIDDYYEHNFSRLFNAIGKEKYQKFLQGILASRSDFPQALIAPLLSSSIQEANKVIELMSPLIPIHNECINIFHKSVKDWLVDEDLAGQYAVVPLLGHKHLASLCLKQIKAMKESFALSTVGVMSDLVNHYIIKNGIHHMCSSKDPHLFPQMLSTVEDLQFMYFRLTMSQGNTEDLLEDLAEVRKAVAKNILLRQRAQDCYSFIQKCAHLLNNKPYLVFQCALNQPDVFAERVGIQKFLSDPLKAFPELKGLLQVKNKSQQLSSSLITFTCNNDITSCVYTPDSKVLVCSDDSGFIYFWDVETGNAINIIDFSQEFSLINIIHHCSISPDGNLLVYGKLTEALNPDGEKEPLLTVDKEHNVNTCIFSQDGRSILAFTYRPDGFFRLLQEIQLSYHAYGSFYVELWNVSASECRTLHSTTHKDKRPMCACFSSDGSKVFCGYRNGHIVCWETRSATAAALLFPTGMVIQKGKYSTVTAHIFTYTIIIYTLENWPFWFL